MPLLHSKSRKAIGRNIATEENAGKPHKQAVAIALNTARASGAKISKGSGGAPAHNDPGPAENKAPGFPFHNEPSDGGAAGSHDHRKHHGRKTGGDGSQ